jgi:hypothetical protein
MGFLAVCRQCFLFSGSIFYLLYAVLVFLISVLKLDQMRVRATESGAQDATLPPLPGELGRAFKFDPTSGIAARLLAATLHVLSFDFFQHLVELTLRFIRFAFVMGDRPSFLVSLRRYFTFYMVIIPLPAAFLAPVLHLQRRPDEHLLVAVVLLILVNAIGDVISVRLTLKNFEKLEFKQMSLDDTSAERFWTSAGNEALYYLNVLKGALYALGVLAIVLAISSVLFGIQIGEYDFSLSHSALAGAWHRAINFPALALEPYWFRGEAGPFGSMGIPGLFLYGVVTFIPIIMLFALAAVWLMLLPLRIAVNLPAGRIPRIISSEAAVIMLCFVVTHLTHFDVFGLLKQIWTV